MFEEDVIHRFLRAASTRYKKKRSRRMYGMVKTLLKKHEENIRSLKLRLKHTQFGLER